MDGEGFVQVGVLSSRPGLDLAINYWMPGYEARTSEELDAVLDVVDGDGIIVVDLVDADRHEVLRALEARGVQAPVVAVVPVGVWAGEPLPGDPIVVTAPMEGSPLAEALALACQQRSAAFQPAPALADSVGGSVVTERVIDLTDPATSPVSHSSVTVPAAARTATPVIDDSAPARSGSVDELDVGGVLRAWALLAELEHQLGSASAVVGVRTTSGAHTIVAGVDISPDEAERPIPGDHPVLTALTSGPGWLVRPSTPQRTWADLPMQACDHLLLVAIPGTVTVLDGVLAIGHFRDLDERLAATVDEVATDRERLQRRVRLLLGAATPLDLDALTSGRTLLSAPSVTMGWNLLSVLYPHLRGPAVVLNRTSGGDFVTTACQHVSPRDAVRAIDRQHALLRRMRAVQGPVVDVAGAENRELFAGLPLPPSGSIGAFPVGDPAAPEALVLLARPEAIPTADQERLVAGIRAHPCNGDTSG